MPLRFAPVLPRLLLLGSLATTAATGQAGPPAGVPRLDPAFRLVIGRADGDPRQVFSRIGGAVRLTNGTVVIADQESNEIRWFSPTGAWLRTTGGSGSGPGEFEGLRSLLRLHGDSVLAEDIIGGRMTLYDGAGRLARSWRVPEVGGSAPHLIGQLGDGSLVSVSERATSPPPGHLRYTATLHRHVGGSLRDTIGRTPGGESFNIPCGAKNAGSCAVPIPYGMRTVAAVSGDQIFTGNGARYEIRVFAPGRGLLRTITREVPPTALDATRVAFYRDSVLGPLSPARRRLAAASMDQAPVPKVMPSFSQLFTDDASRLWVGRPRAVRDTARSWDLFATTGAYLGEVRLPANLRVTQIANDHVVSIVTDRDGVEQVQVLRLRQP